MNVQRIDERASKGVPILVVAALSSLVTSWALHTPELSKKAEELPKVQAEATKAKAVAKDAVVVEKKTLDVAGCEQWRAQVTEQVAKAAIRGANSDSAPIPATSAIPADHCQDQALK